jgi:hypothetical protein
MDIFSINPQIEPRNTELLIDELPRQKETLKLSLRSHNIIVREKGRGDEPTANERPFKLRAVDVWHAWWNDKQPYWPLFFDVPVDFNREAPEKIELVKDEGEFDPVFRGSKPQLKFEAADGEISSHFGEWREDGSILFSWPYEPGAVGSISLVLPYGKYRLTASFADKQNCDKSTLRRITSKPGVDSAAAEEISVERKCT